MSLLIDPNLLLFILSSFLAVIAAVMVVWHRSIVYSAFFLSILGIANAILFAILGFPIISLFHLAVYVGAAVTFILFSLVMMREAPSVEPETKITAVISVIMLIILFSELFIGARGETSFYLNYRDLTSILLERYWFSLLVAALALVTTLIEAITLARREV
ncbi:MAG: NADH-quinone oxidoreductase subunit J family protein [Candidatus Methanodesulfokora washburnensis]|jgi:NADH-quinone oxidoreductase subunit J